MSPFYSLKRRNSLAGFRIMKRKKYGTAFIGAVGFSGISKGGESHLSISFSVLTYTPNSALLHIPLEGQDFCLNLTRILNQSSLNVGSTGKFKLSCRMDSGSASDPMSGLHIAGVNFLWGCSERPIRDGELGWSDHAAPRYKLSLKQPPPATR